MPIPPLQATPNLERLLMPDEGIIYTAKLHPLYGWPILLAAVVWLAAGAAFERVYQTIQSQGSTAGSSVPLYPFDKFSNLMGFDWVSSFDQAHAQKD